MAENLSYSIVKCSSATSLVLHCNENPIYVFLFWKLRGLSPNFHIHVSVIDLYISRIGPHISSRRISRSIVGTYKLLTDTIPIVGIFVSNFGIGSLQFRPSNNC